MEKTKEYKIHNHLPDEEIQQKISSSWGVGRLFRYLRVRQGYHGETLILANILRLRNPYSHRSILSVINNQFEERITQETKKYLLNIKSNR